MSLESVKKFLADKANDLSVIELSESTATVQLAANALGVEPGQIAKTLSMRINDDVIVIVARGDARLDNRKFKERFGVKAKMLDAADVEARTGHPVGGVCPFALPDAVSVYCDVSLKAYDEVIPAGGAPNAAVRVSPMRMADLVNAQWINVTQS
ncbi:cys-tRNA(pro)/cys-tRNA(cys) deacylase [Burkholderia sp. Nafp2/4-1b]|uniref:YbaK/EbsC family protein n=1 Tax=Burkholderia sp. Nafp2/4-1b TaxID=2116686 RepID=UPI000EF8601B|nr:YbaK/EbsC family protein [Burkholderia sp. Nafp2/4-1b]RKT99053.1 cys-tRNA(pro)/cys-tRNA(cys) deacylase [Burkholderia sp. Nafp2/4-1b]